MRIKFIIFFLACLPFFAHAQFNPNQPPNTFRSADNPYYWKNKLPYSDYWQQDVYYQINAAIDEKTDIITASQNLTYWNNSPDTLHFVYFHLYQEAFQPGSYYDQLQRENNVKPEYGRYESQGLGTEIESLLVNGQQVEMEQDNTILKVWLPRPLEPGGSVVFDIDFKTYFDEGSVRRRMKVYDAWGHRHYNGVHWYPRISVYDRKFGWTTDQHLGREFYGNFGTYDVRLTFSSNYVVEATGQLQNRGEVLPDDLMEQLHISNFADKPWNEPPSEIIPYNPDERKTWHFYAENVHDFAFTADPTYRIDRIVLTNIPFPQKYPHDIEVVAIVQEPHAAGWHNAASYTAKVTQVYSGLAGMYAWPKIVVADARDGMEYPMLTLDGGFDPFYRDLLAHEVAHMWFFGMVGTNETYRAAMDEGFTQFLDSYGMRIIDGPVMPSSTVAYNKWQQWFKRPVTIKDEEVYLGYVPYAAAGEDAVLNTHSDDFGGALRHGGGYRHVYYKTATMLYNLEYVLGEQLFWESFQHYFDKWSMMHPYWEDFKLAVTEYTNTDFNWFFDQWFDTDEKIDYAIKDIDRVERGVYDITFERIGEMQMPIDFAVMTETDTFYYHIPNTWFEKETNATVLPRWIGWGKLNPEYTVRIGLMEPVNLDDPNTEFNPAKIKNVVIDPSQRLADVNMLNNSKKSPLDVRFDAEVYNRTDWTQYILKWRPDLWYNSIDGLKPGLHLEGDYMNRKHVFNLSAWYNTGLLSGFNYHDDEVEPEPTSPVSFMASYSTALDQISRQTFFFTDGMYEAGVIGGRLGIRSDIRPDYTLSVFVKSFIRPTEQDRMYALFEDQWSVDQWNNSINLQLTHPYQYFRGNGNINLHLRSATLLSDSRYSYLALEVINNNRLGKLNFRTRTYGRWGTEGTPPESALYFAMASPEEMLDNKFYRAKGFIPAEYAEFGADINHFHYGGGLNLRGYNGYVVVEEQEGNSYLMYRRNSGASINAELEFDELISFNPGFLRFLHMDLYLFGDVGTMAFEDVDGNLHFSEPRLDAGIGTALSINRFFNLETVNPLMLRFDVPFYVSHAPYADRENFAFRWLLGVRRAF